MLPSAEALRRSAQGLRPRVGSGKQPFSDTKPESIPVSDAVRATTRNRATLLTGTSIREPAEFLSAGFRLVAAGSRCMGAKIVPIRSCVQ